MAATKPPPPPSGGKKFEALVELKGDKGISQSLQYQNIPESMLIAIEGALLQLGPQLNANPPPKQQETKPRIQKMTLSATVRETADNNGKPHGNPKPFFGPVEFPWHDVPAYAAPYVWNLVTQALAPYAQFLVPVLLILVGLWLSTGTAQAQQDGGRTWTFQPPPVTVQPAPITLQPPAISVTQPPPIIQIAAAAQLIGQQQQPILQQAPAYQQAPPAYQPPAYQPPTYQPVQPGLSYQPVLFPILVSAGSTCERPLTTIRVRTGGGLFGGGLFARGNAGVSIQVAGNGGGACISCRR